VTYCHFGLLDDAKNFIVKITNGNKFILFTYFAFKSIWKTSSKSDQHLSILDKMEVTRHVWDSLRMSIKWDGMIWSGITTKIISTILGLKISFEHHLICDIGFFEGVLHDLKWIYNAVFTFSLIILFNLFHLQKYH
jgi:hypothetical protein